MTKTTRKALLSSVVALAICLTMLVGTTFAWFTDTASTAVNTVKSGTLKVDIVDTDGNSLKDGTLSFKNKEGKTDIKWEPGVTFNTDTFKISNKGSLALKYKIAINGLDGDSELLKVIDFSVVNKTTGETVSLDTFVGHLAKDETSSDELYIQGKMKTDAGNAYMGKELEGISLVVTATQDTVEYDSTTKDYDKDATFPDGSASDSTDEWTIVTTQEQLNEALANGGNIKLGANIEVEVVKNEYDDNVVIYKYTSTPATLDLNGHKITCNSDSVALICVEESTLTIKDSVGGGEIVNSGYTIDCSMGGTLNIESGTIKSSTKDAVWVNIGSNATISGGTISSNFNTIWVYGCDADNKCTLKITGGEIICTKNEDDSSAIGAARYADVEISGGTITGVLEVYQELEYNVTGTYTITGGTFSHDPSDYLKSGYKVTESNGKYIVTSNN